MGSHVILAIAERDLRAGARVLRGLMSHEHPMVQRAIVEALADSGRHQALGCVARMEAALLPPGEVPVSGWWTRLRASMAGWVERNIIADDPGGDWG